MLIGNGTFEGRGGHVLRGTFRFDRSDGGVVRLTTSDDFFFDGSPAPGFALSASGDPSAAEAAATDFLRLPGSGSLSGAQIEVRGAQGGIVPDSIDIRAQKVLFLWCYITPFLLGVGVIEHSG
ncbi:hypothetical protein [Citreimonas sp.]|uniref:hypothetical protein n=1 Tax=Citreimonas sp. TaxID=3036715 RepID=UPI0035C7BB8C